MAQVTVRKLDDRAVRTLKRRAKAHGHSLEQELRQIITAEATPGREEGLAEVERIRAMTPARLSIDVEALIREDRDR